MADVFNTITDADWRHSIKLGRERKNRVVAQFREAEDRLVREGKLTKQQVAEHRRKK